MMAHTRVAVVPVIKGESTGTRTQAIITEIAKAGPPNKGTARGYDPCYRRRNFIRRFKGSLSQMPPADIGQLRLGKVGPVERAIMKAVINVHLAEGRLLWWIAEVATNKLPEPERQEDWTEIRQRMADLVFRIALRQTIGFARWKRSISSLR
jgi:hypothetical protein